MKKETLANVYNYAPMVTFEIPKIVGHYVLGGEYGLKIGFTYKPNWFHRTMMKLCLGWKWVTFNTNKENLQDSTNGYTYYPQENKTVFNTKEK